MSKLYNTLKAAIEAANGNTFTLKVLVIYGNPIMALHGVHIHGAPWASIQPGDITFTQKQADEVFKALGLDFVGRPVKQPSMYYHWLVAKTAEPDLRMLRWMGNESNQRADNYAPFLQAVAA